MNKPGKVIVLNGASSSGKTTLARTFQDMCSEEYLLCALDAFWNMTPPHISANSNNFPGMKLAMAKSIKALAETGHYVIVDTVFSGKQTYDELLTELEGIDLTIIMIDCPIEELRRRELARGDRKIGLAESQYQSVHEGVSYDFTINTFEATPAECAQQIMNRL